MAEILRTCCLRQHGEFLQLAENKQDYHVRKVSFDVGYICPKGTGIELISGLSKLCVDAPKVLRQRHSDEFKRDAVRIAMASGLTRRQVRRGFPCVTKAESRMDQRPYTEFIGSVLNSVYLARPMRVLDTVTR